MSRENRERCSMATVRTGRRAWLAAGAVLASTAAFAGDEALPVTLKNHQFEPKIVRVKPGQTVRFDNADDVLHSLTLIGHENTIGEEFVDPGKSYTMRIPGDLSPGTYELACTIHVDMRGQLEVRED